MRLPKTTKCLLSNFVKPVGFSLAISIGTISLPTVATAQMSAYEQQKVIQYLRTSRTEMKLDIFDGTNFVAGTDKKRAYNYMADFISGMNKATRIVSGMTSHARGTTEGQGFIEETNKKLDYARAMQAAYPAFEKSTAEAATAGTTAPAKSAATPSKPAATTPAQTETATLPTAEERATITVHFDKIDTLLETGPFDGTTFKDGTSMDEARALINSLSDAGNAATKAFNALPAESQRAPDAREIINKIREYQNKKRPVQNALNDYRRIREPIEAAAANEVHEERVAICNALNGSFETSNRAFQTVVGDVADYAKKEGWENANSHPSIQGINFEWGNEAAQILSKCEANNYTALAEVDFACRSWAASDPVAWCRTAAAYVETNKEEIAETAARVDAIAPVCEAFSETVMTRKNRRSMKRVLNLENANVYDPKVTDLIRFAQSIEGECSKPEFEVLSEVACSSEQSLENPTTWCEASSTKVAQLRDRIVNWYDNPTTWSASMDTMLGGEEKLLRNDGWMTPETKVTYANLFDFERSLTQPRTNNRSLIETLEVLDIDPTKFATYDDTLDVIDDMTAVIEEKASSWRKTSVKEDFTGYVTNLAAEKLVTNWHPTAKVEGKWLGSSEWNIERTGLGFIDNRWVRGYVMLKLPEDPYCQLHMIFVTEQYDGGKFVQSPDIQAKKMRFQACDHQ